MNRHDKRTGRIGKDRLATVERMIAEGATAPAIADALDVNQETIRKYARKRGIVLPKGYVRMEDHPSWKGGETEDRDGYLFRRVLRSGRYGYLIRASGLRSKDSHGYAAIHRIQMHDKLGRPLLPGEVVHHKDEDTRNNDPSNLELFASNAEHLRATLKGKVPDWTPQGKARMTGRPHKIPEVAPAQNPIADLSKNDDQA